MRRRIFIAINLPQDVKNKLGVFQNKMGAIPAKWVKKENLHITVAFLGSLAEDEIFQVITATKEITSNMEPFFIDLHKIAFFPEKKMPPRMIWVHGEESKELALFEKELNRSLAGIFESPEENKQFIPHITLARINQWDFRRIDPGEIPVINDDFLANFKVSSIDIMESQLKKGGAQYALLESCDLQG